MKRSSLLMMVVALLFCFGSLAGAAPGPGLIEEDANQEAIKVAENYFNNIIKESADGKNGTPLIDFRIVSVDQSNPESIKLYVETIFKDSEKLPAAPYKIVKENGEFKVKNEPIVYNMIPGSLDYGTVSIGNVNEIDYQNSTNDYSIEAVIPNSYYYNSEIIGPGVYNYLIGSSFSTTKSNLTINGWQEISPDPNNPSDGDIQLRYGVAEKLSTGSYKRLAQSSLFKGDYPKNGTWLNAYLTNVPKGDNRVVYVLNEFFSTAVVSGNVYE